jgi:beta-glucosidase
MQGKPVRFPFGHGLSYTSFEYSWGEPPTALLQPTVLRWAAADGARGEGGGGAASSGLASGGTDVAANMSVLIRNSGAVAGAEVVQLYLRFPPAARQPSLVLRSFIKTRLLEPRQSEVVSLALTRRDLSTWAPGAGWDIARGEFVVVVGASSRDGRLVASVVVG